MVYTKKTYSRKCWQLVLFGGPSQCYLLSKAIAISSHRLFSMRVIVLPNW